MTRRVQREDPDPWEDRGACRGKTVAIFFPTRGEDVRIAQAICAECPVKVECLDHALAAPEWFGVWGGLSERERRRLRRRRSADRTAERARQRMVA